MRRLHRRDLPSGRLPGGCTPDKIIFSELSSDGRYLLVTVSHGAAATKNELYFRDNWAGNRVHAIVNDIDATFEGHIAGGTLFVLTNWEAPNRRLFAAVVCAYPLLDMLRYHHFLVAGYWVPEYGSAADPVQFEYLAGYSPYHHVVRGTRYPAVMLVTGDGDTRVAPLHARKMTALLQAETGSSNPVLLLYDAEAGHSGGRPVRATIEEITAELRFLLWRTR